MKIARWNDINFHALRAAVERTRKTLHRHVKQLGAVLAHPVQPLLTAQPDSAWGGRRRDPGLELGARGCGEGEEGERTEVGDQEGDQGDGAGDRAGDGVEGQSRER